MWVPVCLRSWRSNSLAPHLLAGPYEAFLAAAWPGLLLPVVVVLMLLCWCCAAGDAVLITELLISSRPATTSAMPRAQRGVICSANSSRPNRPVAAMLIALLMTVACSDGRRRRLRTKQAVMAALAHSMRP